MKKHRKSKMLNFQVGDLVEINFDFLRMEPFDNLYIVISVERDEKREVFWPDKKYVRLHVREVSTGRELQSIVCISKGEEYSEFLHVV